MSNTAPPRPLSAFDARGLRGVLTDIDDTLTHEGAIEPEALAALGALRERTDLAAIAEAVHALQVDPHAPVREALGDELWSAWGDALSRLAP